MASFFITSNKNPVIHNPFNTTSMNTYKDTLDSVVCKIFLNQNHILFVKLQCKKHDNNAYQEILIISMYMLNSTLYFNCRVI